MGVSPQAEQRTGYQRRATYFAERVLEALIDAISRLAVILITGLAGSIVAQFLVAWKSNLNTNKALSNVKDDVTNQVKNENQNLINQVTSISVVLTTMLQNADGERIALGEKVKALEAQLADRKRISEENTRQIEENQKTFDDKIAKLQKDSSTMQQDLINAKEELARTKAEHEQTKADLIKAQERIKALEDEREKERAASSLKIEQLTQELETERGKAKHMQTQLDNQAERIKFLESEVQRLSTVPPEPPKPAGPTTP